MQRKWKKMIKSIEQKLFLLKNIQLNKNIILIKKHVTNDKINIKIRLNLNKKKQQLIKLWNKE